MARNPFSVTNAQIQSQIDVLTNDFRAWNGGSIGNAPSVFQGLTSDTEFGSLLLANVGPNCSNGVLGLLQTLIADPWL